MASTSTHLLLILFLSFVLLTISVVSADKHEDFQLQDVNYPQPQAPVTYIPPTPPVVKPSTPPPATVHPPTPPAKPYTPPPATKPSTPPVKTYPTTPPKAPAPPVVSPYTPPPKAPAPPIATPPAPYHPPVKKEDCVPLCEARCTLHSRKRVCVRACSTCCERCKCVPPGTSGNREVCGTCWTDMRTHGNRFKCP